MKTKIIDIVKQGITHFDDIQHFTQISKRNLAILLDELVIDGILFHPKKNTYGYIQTGTLLLNKNGYGFIQVPGEENDYYVGEEQIVNLYDGDLVYFYPYDNGYRLLNANIIGVKERCHNFIIGSFERKTRRGKLKSYIYSTNPRFEVRAIVKKEIEGLENGMIVYGRISYVGTAIEAEVLEIIGHKDDPGIEISQIALEYGFETEFPKEVYDEIHQIPNYVLESEKKNRRDFREEIIFTIDGEDSKDFDDAVSIKLLEDGNYLLGVYIADVSSYVVEGSPLDQEALKRGTSVYLADRVIPMLPHKLSNGICSLNEGEDRLVLACLMTISPKGKLVNYDICEGLICSKHRMTYTQVNAILNQEKTVVETYPNLIEPLTLMQNLSHILRKNREKKGALEFEIPEYKFKLDQNGKPISIVPIIRDDAEKLIEDFMLMANETVAYHLNIMNYPCIYRVHEQPDQEKLMTTLDELAELGIPMMGKQKRITPLHLQKLIEETQQFPHYEIFHQMILRSMMKAKYSDGCLGHYGLAMKYYCHFTSPIRRYPDLMVHRLVKNLLLHPVNLEKQMAHYTSILSDIATKTSVCERKSIDCERDVNDMLYAWYMESYIHHTFTGIISSVTSFGIFVTLENGVEGLIHVDTMTGFFDYIEEQHCYTNGEITYHLGDEVEIIVVDANRQEKTVDFMFIRDYNLTEV